MCKSEKLVRNPIVREPSGAEESNPAARMRSDSVEAGRDRTDQLQRKLRKSRQRKLKKSRQRRLLEDFDLEWVEDLIHSLELTEAEKEKSSNSQ